MSAPRLAKDVNYWLKKGKTGKNVCLYTHDDMDGIVSAIIMKNWLLNRGFTIKKVGIVNYTEGWSAFDIDEKLINIALDFADDSPMIDYYVDHHGKFDEDVKLTQKRYSIKTPTGSAAEGIAQQLGLPFSDDIKKWIDMIDSAKYSEY